MLPEHRVRDLPLVNGDILELVRIMPGVRPGLAGDANSTFAGLGVGTINTVRDGLSVSDTRSNTGLFATTTINPDLVGEIRIILAPVDAEQGRGNGQIQIQTRSGTNRYTGSAVWNVRNSALNANLWDNNRDVDPFTGQWSPTPLDWRNTHQYTVSYGGPIVRNKTFFFALWDHNISNTRTLVTNTCVDGHGAAGHLPVLYGLEQRQRADDLFRPSRPTPQPELIPSSTLRAIPSRRRSIRTARLTPADCDAIACLAM